MSPRRDVMTDEDHQEETVFGSSPPAGNRARQAVEQMVDAGLFDDLMGRIDDGGLQLTGEGSFLPEMIKAVLERGLQAVAGDNADRVRSEPAWARLLGVAPVPASSGLTNRHRLNRGGHRQANAALYRAVIVRMQFHEPTKAYVTRRTAEGKTKREIIRCLIG